MSQHANDKKLGEKKQKTSSKLLGLGHKKKPKETSSEISNPQSDHTYTRNYENQTKHLKIALSNQVQNTMSIREEFRELNNRFDVEVLSRRKAEAEQEELTKKLASLRSKVLGLEKQHEQEKMRTEAIKELFGCDNVDSSQKRATLSVSRGLRDPLQREHSDATGNNTLTFRKGKMPEIYSIVNKSEENPHSPRRSLQMHSASQGEMDLSSAKVVPYVPLVKPRSIPPPLPGAITHKTPVPKVISNLPRPPPRNPNTKPSALSSTSPVPPINLNPDNQINNQPNNSLAPNNNHNNNTKISPIRSSSGNNNNVASSNGTPANNNSPSSGAPTPPLRTTAPSKIPMRPLYKPAPPKTPPPPYILNTNANPDNNNNA